MDASVEPLQLKLKPLVTPLSPKKSLPSGEGTSSPTTVQPSTQSISQDQIDASPQKLFSDAYFSELLSYSLERLNKEPELLKDDLDRIGRQITESAVEHYPAFVEATKSLGLVENEVGALESHLEGLSHGLPNFSKSCEDFREGARMIMERRSENQQLMTQHQSILGLLEIPQLMDACVRNGNYDEALDFQLFVNRLGALHGDMAVVKSLVEDVKGVTNLMLRQLMQKLKSNIQLPECLGVIGYLRRLAIFSERELRLCFLACREEWISGLVMEVDDSNAYDFLKRMIDIHRLHLFDVVMQYRAVFSDESSGVGVASSNGGDGGLLSGWALHRLGLYLDALRAHLPRVGEGSNISSILEHCMYCGMSLGRVGLDFRGLLPSVFEPCMVEVFSERMISAVEGFESLLESHKWVSLPSALTTRSTGGGAQVNANGQANGEHDTSPPNSLVEHLPLAAFVNGVLAAFNELRHCAPSALRKPVAGLLQDSLGRVASSMAQYSVTHDFEDSQKRVFKSACKAMVKVAAPYLATCLDRLYSDASKLVDVDNAMLPLQEIVGGGN